MRKAVGFVISTHCTALFAKPGGWGHGWWGREHSWWGRDMAGAGGNLAWHLCQGCTFLSHQQVGCERKGEDGQGRRAVQLKFDLRGQQGWEGREEEHGTWEGWVNKIC